MSETAIRAKAHFKDSGALRQTDSSRLYLAMELSTSHFDCCLHDITTNQLLAIEKYDFFEGHSFSSILPELKSIFDHSEIINTQVHRAGIAVDHSISTLIPNALFNEDKLEDYISANFNLQEDYKVLYNDLPNVKAKNIFGFPQSIFNFFEVNYKTVDHFHSSTSFIETLALKNKNNKGASAAVRMGKSEFQLLIFEGHSLQFFNTLSFFNEDDFLYFLLFVFEQLRIDAHNIPLKIYGEIDRQSPLIQKLSQYAGNIDIAIVKPEVNAVDSISQLQLNGSYSLLNLHSCVL